MTDILVYFCTFRKKKIIIHWIFRLWNWKLSKLEIVVVACSGIIILLNGLTLPLLYTQTYNTIFFFFRGSEDKSKKNPNKINRMKNNVEGWPLIFLLPIPNQISFLHRYHQRLLWYLVACYRRLVELFVEYTVKCSAIAADNSCIVECPIFDRTHKQQQSQLQRWKTTWFSSFSDVLRA